MSYEALPYLVTVHLLGMVLWLGGLLQLSRVLVLHAKEDASVRPRLSYLEGRLDAGGAIPGAVLTIATGIAQILVMPSGTFATSRWLHWKLLLVIAIVGLHLVLTLRHRRLARERADRPVGKGFFAAAHGVIGLLLIGIVYLAVARPLG